MANEKEDPNEIALVGVFLALNLARADPQNCPTVAPMCKSAPNRASPAQAAKCISSAVTFTVSLHLLQNQLPIGRSGGIGNCRMNSAAAGLILNQRTALS